MIKTLIFDFGDVFINLDKPATERELLALGFPKLTHETITINESYETGVITTKEFIAHYKTLHPIPTEKEIITAWNAILLDLPIHRLKFIQQLASEKKYKLILLSNTNELHINWIKQNIPSYKTFYACFDSFYLSHEIQLRKPDTSIFEFVLKQHQLIPQETLFIDDTKINTDSAATLGIHTWNNDPLIDDITKLFSVKTELF